MIHPRTLVLIDKLCEMTRQKKIAWQLGEDETIIHDTEGYRVILTSDPEELILTDPLGRELEKADEQELAETMDEDGKPYTAAVHELVRNAGRIAKGTEFAIEKVLASLDLDGDGIPDLPPPPGIEELAAEEGAASDDLIEDTTEETAPFAQEAESFAEDTEAAASEVGESDTDIADAVAKMADEVNTAPEEVSEPAKPTPSMGGFGAFAAGASVLGGTIASTTLGSGETKTGEDTPPDPELTADAMQLADLQEAARETVAGQSETINESTIERDNDLAGSGNTPDIIDDNVVQAPAEAANTLSSQEQSIADMVESFAGTDEQSAAAPSPAEPETPKLFTLSGIPKRTDITGAAVAAAEKASDTLGNIGENAGNLAGEAKEALDERADEAAKKSRVIIDDLAEPEIEIPNSNGDAKPKPSTRFNPWK